MTTSDKRFSELSTDEKHAFWSEVETRIRGVLDDLGPDVPATVRDELIGYLQHNELGLALEGLCDALIEEDRTVSEAQHAEIERLFGKMEMDPTGRLEHIAPKRAGS